MPNCPECHGIEIGGQVAHKPGCSLKPKAAAAVCPECGAPKTLRGIQHKPGCSKNPVKRVEDFLARPIGLVCKAAQPGVLPMNSYSPAQGHIHLPSGKDLLQAPAAVGEQVPAVSDRMMERLLSALASIENANAVAIRAITDRMTIRAFRALGEGPQLAFVNKLWNATCTSHAFETRGDTMSDPLSDDMAGRSLPSSVCPIRPGANTFRKRLTGRQPFREFGIGFRTDGGDKSSITRILGSGMTQQRLSTTFMLGPKRGLRLDATVMMDKSRARCWTGNNDIFNETAVCVSRNLFGGTAFPERSSSGLFYLWAVNCGPLLGFDTEEYQLGLPNSRQWRPGEKAFPFIPAANLLAYVQVDRRGAPSGGGWMFDLNTGAQWTFVGSPTVKQRKYLEDELAAWKGGSYTIPPAYDFAEPTVA